MLVFKETYPIAVAPIKLVDDTTIGVLWMVRHSKEYFSDKDLVWLECMADQVVITIQHGLMTSQIQTQSIVEERARIAREMHDSLAQVLGYLNLKIQTLESLLEQGKQPVFQKIIDYLRDTKGTIGTKA